MSSIDERIVEMKFNNSQFERGVQKTLSSLDGLKKGLNLGGAAKGLQDVDKAAKGLNFQPIADGVAAIGSKFTAMSLVAIGALTNIVNKAVAAGSQIVKSLTIDPVKAGLDEYELKMGSIQTILANTSRHGTGLQEVVDNLDELNKYADQTIYNFGAMTSNIGLFTNAGIKVGDATTMIKGFSNEAAASGTSAQGAAGAAYQLSQALSAGTIRLMDWRSLQNVGMGNKNMQNGLIELATAMGAFEGKTITAAQASQDFNGSLEKEWLSADVMSTYLKIMSGDMDTAAIAALGLNEAQVKMFQDQAAMGLEAATKVRTWTQLIGTMQEGVGSGWSETFDIIIGDFDEATELWTNVNNVLGEMISASGDARNKLLQEWKDLGGRDAAIAAVSNAFQALMAILTPVKEAFREIFPAVTGQQLFDLTVKIRDFFATIKIGEGTAQNLKATFRGFFAALDIGRMILMGLLGVFGELFGEITKGGGGVLEFTGNMGDMVVRFRDALKNGEGLQKFFSGLAKVVKAPVQAVKALAGFLKDLFTGGFAKGGDAMGSALDSLKTRFEPLAGSLEFAKKAFEGFLNVARKVGDFIRPFVQEVGEALSGLGEKIVEAFKTGDFSGIFDALNTGLFAAITLAITKFLKGGINIDLGAGGLVDSIKDVFGGLTDTLSALQANIKADTLLKIAAAVGILTVSVVALSMIDSAALTKSLTAITVMFGQLVGALALFEKVSTVASAAKMTLIAGGLILLAGAMVILSVAVKNLSDLDWNELAKGLTGVVGMLGAVAGAAKLLKGNAAGLITAGIGMIAMATGLVIMAAAVKDFADMDWDELGKGLTGAAGGMIILAGASKILSMNSGKTLLASVGMIAMAAAMKIMASVLEDFAGFNWGEIGRGLTAMAGSIILLAAALLVIPPTGIVGAAGLLVAAFSLVKVAEAMSEFAKMDWGGIGRSMTLLFGVLLLMAAALWVIPPTAVLGAAGLIVAAEGLLTMAKVMQEFGEMSWGEIGKSVTILFASLLLLALGLTAMIAALPGAAALWVAVEALWQLPPVMEALADLEWDVVWKALGIMAVTMLAIAVAGMLIIPALPGLIGLGVAAALIGIGALAAGAGLLMFSTGLTALAVGGAAAMTTLDLMITKIIGYIPIAIKAVGEGIVLMAGVIRDNGPVMVDAMSVLLGSILTAIDENSPKIIDTLWGLVLKMVQKLRDNVPLFVDAGLKMTTGILNGIAKNMGPLVTAGTNVIVEFLKGIQKNLPRITNAGADTIIAFVRSVASTIRTRSAEMRAAGLELAWAIADGMTFGLASKARSLASKAADMANQAVQGAKRALGIASPSKEFKKIGRWTAEGFAIGITTFASLATKASENMGLDSMKTLQKSLSGASSLNLDKLNIQPVIRPVVDLSNIENARNRIGAELSKPMPIIPTVSTDYASQVSAQTRQNQADAFQPSDKENTPASSSSQVNYTQNIYSPKAISEAEVYRQTNNQLSKIKEGLKK